jgi:hypothetical protein
MSKSKVQPIRPAAEHDDVTDAVQVSQTEILQADSIIKLVMRRLTDGDADSNEQVDCEFALAAVSVMLERSWERLNGCHDAARDVQVAS